MLDRSTRVTRILSAQERVDLARHLLERLPFTDPRFANAINEYGEAIEARRQVEGEGR